MIWWHSRTKYESLPSWAYFPQIKQHLDNTNMYLSQKTRIAFDKIKKDTFSFAINSFSIFPYQILPIKITRKFIKYINITVLQSISMFLPGHLANRKWQIHFYNSNSRTLFEYTLNHTWNLVSNS